MQANLFMRQVQLRQRGGEGRRGKFVYMVQSRTNVSATTKSMISLDFGIRLGIQLYLQFK